MAINISEHLEKQNGFSERMAAALETLATANVAGSAEGLKIKSWAHLQEIVRLGQAKNFLSVGDQIAVSRETSIVTHYGNTESETAGVTGATVNEEVFLQKIGEARDGADYVFTYDGAEWYHNGAACGASSSELAAEYGISYTGTAIAGDVITVHETASNILFDVIGIDHPDDIPAGREHALTLLSHPVVVVTCFDTSEALIYAVDALPAGTYTIGISNAYDKTYHTYDYYTFTTTTEIPAGAQIMIGWAYQQQPKTVTVYNSVGATASSASYTLTGEDEASGILLCTATSTDITEKVITVGETEITLQINTISRARYGSNYYPTSGARQWLNTDASLSDWWTPQTIFDRPHSLRASRNWQYGLDPEFLSVVVAVPKGFFVQSWDSSESGYTYETVTDKFFLPSYKEIAGCTFSLTTYGSEAEGEQYEYYNNLIGAVSSDYQTKPSLIKYDANGTARTWFLRTPHSGNASGVRYVASTGYLSNSSAHTSYALAPACVIA